MVITVRRASKSDVPAIFNLNNKLGVALKYDKPLVSLEDLYRDGGFDGNTAYFFTLLAEDSEYKDSNGSPAVIGSAICSYSYSWIGKTLFLSSFFVEESYRSKGVGKLMFNELIKHAKEADCVRLDVEAYGWNTRARKFYEREGAVDATHKDILVMHHLPIKKVD